MAGSVLEEFFIQIGVNADDVRAGEKAVTAAVLGMQKQLQGLVESFDKSSEQARTSQKKLGQSTEKVTKDLEASAKKTSDYFGGLKRELLAFAGITLSIGGAVGFVKQMTNGLQQLDVQSKALNSSAKAIDGWRKAYEAAGSSAADADANLTSMQNSISQFANGNVNTPMANLARMLGVNVDYQNGTADGELRKVLSALGNVQDRNRQRALAQEAGISDATLSGVRDGSLLRNQRYFEQNSTVSEDETRRAVAFRLELVKLGAKFDNLKNKIYADIIPSLDDLLTTLNKWYEENALENSEFTAKLKEITGIDLKHWSLADDIKDLVKNFGELGRTLSHLNNALNALNNGDFSLALSEFKKAWNGDAGDKDALPGVTANASAAQGDAKSMYQKWNDRLNRYLPEWMGGAPNQQEPPQHAQAAKATRKGAALLDWMSGEFGQLESKYGLPAGLLRSVATTESGGNQFAVSGAGAKGLFQFMDGTAGDLGLKGNDVFDPQKSAQAAAKYLSQLMKRYNGDISKALAAYNWGMGNVDKYGLSKLPAETAAYYPKVLAGLPQSGASLAASRHASSTVNNNGGNVTTENHIGQVNVTSNPRSAGELIQDISKQANSRMTFAFSTGQS